MALLGLAFVMSAVFLLAGSWWGLAFPLAAALWGAVLIATGDTSTQGGDVDPQGIAGVIVFVLAGTWTVVFASLMWARAGHWWALALPVGVALLGGFLYATGQPHGPDHGRVERELFWLGIAWAAVYAGVVGMVRRSARSS